MSKTPNKLKQLLTKGLSDPTKLIEYFYTDQTARTEICRQSHQWFFSIYLPHYIKYPTADFQKKMFEITEDEKNELSVIVAFRNSAKSTIMTLSFPIWAILGRCQKKCVVILCQTRHQARQHMANIKRELENNVLLRSDLGPIKQNEDEWNAGSIVIPKYDARITALSYEQGIRGLRHGEHRPDLIICDDIEDLDSVRTKESRDKTDEWFKGEVVPLGESNTKIIVIGNLLHEDSLIKRMESSINDGILTGKFYFFPIVDENNQPLWPGKFLTPESIVNEQKKIGDDRTWAREYMLKIISNAERPIHPEWINCVEVDPLTIEGNKYVKTIIGVDLATSERDKSDYTAIVTGIVYLDKDNVHRLYISPNPINRHLNGPDMIHLITSIDSLSNPNERPTFIVEDVGYQLMAVQMLKYEGILVIGFNPGRHDKWTRLVGVSNFIKNGSVLFCKEGNKDLISQVVGFGKERRDDLADALVMVITEANRLYKIGYKHVNIPIKPHPGIMRGLGQKDF